MNPLIPLASAAIASGIPFGLCLATDWERKVRKLPLPWLPFGRGSAVALLAGVFLIKIPLTAALFLGLPLLVMLAFGLLPTLRGVESEVFFIYMASIATGQVLRYAYWRWVYRGQLL
jgi:glycerol-3-phosphate acyltransferase PlsY